MDTYDTYNIVSEDDESDDDDDFDMYDDCVEHLRENSDENDSEGTDDFYHVPNHNHGSDRTNSEPRTFVVTPPPPFAEQHHDVETDDSTFYSIPRENQNHQPTNSSSTPSANNNFTSAASASSFPIGARVRITKGKYQGKIGTVIRLCPKLVQVQIENSNHDTPRLQPDRLIIISGQQSASSSSSRPSTNAAATPEYSPSADTNPISEPPASSDPHGFFHLYEDFAQFVTTTTRPSSQKHRTLACRMFGFRLRNFKIPIDASAVATLRSTFPREYTDSMGRSYSLLVTKLTHRSSEFGSFSQSQIQAYAVLSSSSSNSTLKHELECLAGFGRLSTEKVMARLSLLVTPAAAGIKNKSCAPFLLWDDATDGPLSVDDLEDEPMEDNDDWNGGGCGFVPYSFLNRFLGNGIDSKRTFAIQVRIVCPKLGIYKGMLMVKRDITKIQLPSSMKKVGPSEVMDANNQTQVYFLIKGIFPSKNNLHVAKRLRNEVPPQSFQPPKLSKMAQSVFLARGVPSDILHEYVQKSHGRRGRYLQHASLVGLRDPTNAIPEGHVFVTGSVTSTTDDNEAQIGNRVLVTRFPCTQASDARVLPVIKHRPHRMSISDWEALQGLSFGGIVFGNSAEGNLQLPAMIAGGDLDGDLYLVCWNNNVVDALATDFVEQTNSMPLDRQQTVPDWNSSWFEDAQDRMRDVEYLVSVNKLIKELYRLWLAELERDHSSPDAVDFGRAFKNSIDVAKHGVKVPLPSRLWPSVKQEFYPFLCEMATE